MGEWHVKWSFFNYVTDDTDALCRNAYGAVLFDFERPQLLRAGGEGRKGKSPCDRTVCSEFCRALHFESLTCREAGAPHGHCSPGVLQLCAGPFAAGGGLSLHSGFAVRLDAWREFLPILPSRLAFCVAR